MCVYSLKNNYVGGVWFQSSLEFGLNLVNSGPGKGFVWGITLPEIMKATYITGYMRQEAAKSEGIASVQFNE